MLLDILDSVSKYGQAILGFGLLLATIALAISTAQLSKHTKAMAAIEHKRERMNWARFRTMPKWAVVELDAEEVVEFDEDDHPIERRYEPVARLRVRFAVANTGYRDGAVGRVNLVQKDGSQAQLLLAVESASENDDSLTVKSGHQREFYGNAKLPDEGPDAGWAGSNCVLQVCPIIEGVDTAGKAPVKVNTHVRNYL